MNTMIFIVLKVKLKGIVVISNVKSVKIQYEKTMSKVYNFKTKHKEGFTSDELDTLLEREYPTISKDSFYDEMIGNTCIIRDGEGITFKDDVERAIGRCLGLNFLCWD